MGERHGDLLGPLIDDGQECECGVYAVCSKIESPEDPCFLEEEPDDAA